MERAKKLKIVQGNTYEGIEVILKDEDGQLIEGRFCEKVEFMFNGLRKMYPDEVTYDSEKGVFVVPFTQEETFSMHEPLKYQARPYFIGGGVKGTKVYQTSVEESLSKEVL